MTTMRKLVAWCSIHGNVKHLVLDEKRTCIPCSMLANEVNARLRIVNEAGTQGRDTKTPQWKKSRICPNRTLTTLAAHSPHMQLNATIEHDDLRAKKKWSIEVSGWHLRSTVNVYAVADSLALAKRVGLYYLSVIISEIRGAEGKTYLRTTELLRTFPWSEPSTIVTIDARGFLFVTKPNAVDKRRIPPGDKRHQVKR